MKLYQLVVACVLVFGGVVATAVPQEPAKGSEKEPVYAELKKAPEKYRSKTNPLANDADAVPAGRILFEEHCAACHGKEGGGGKKAPSLRAEEVQSSAPGAVFWILSNGVVRKKMPVWSKLPEPERWQLVSYLKSLGTTAAESQTTGKP
jgi:mono/diheme cytochrome c family protein